MTKWLRAFILSILILAAVSCLPQSSAAQTSPSETSQIETSQSETSQIDPSPAQSSDDASAIRREHWTMGVQLNGSTGLFQNDNVQFTSAGVRVGRVMTGELGAGLLRGTFEMDAEIMPVDYVLWNGYRNVYGVGVNPVLFKWNFTHGHKLIPYFLAQGGVLYSAHNIPPGDTCHFNFRTGPGIGFNYFLKPGRSLSFDFRAFHLSNASIGVHNPGINDSVGITVAYNWWQH